MAVTAVIVKKIPGAFCPEGLGRVTPLELADNSDGIAPADCPIMSTCVIVDKMDVAVSDGRGGWYISSGKSIKAGDSWANLF